MQRLETLFRLELGRLDRVPLQSRRGIDAKLSPAEQACAGDDKCLTAVGKRLGVDYVVTGTVGSLGDNYVLNIKAVDVATGKSQRIQSPPLKGTPDELIEGVRVAAYSLLAPDQLHGALQIQSDPIGAAVTLDGKLVGKTPLAYQGVIASSRSASTSSTSRRRTTRRSTTPSRFTSRRSDPVVVRLVGTNEVIGDRPHDHRGAPSDLHAAVVHRDSPAVSPSARDRDRLRRSDALGELHHLRRDVDGAQADGAMLGRLVAMLAIVFALAAPHARSHVAVAPLSTLGAEDSRPRRRR